MMAPGKPHLKPASTNDFARLPMDSSVLEYVVMFIPLQTFHELSEIILPRRYCAQFMVNNVGHTIYTLNFVISTFIMSPTF
jgi:hypothetical protein